jgi:hypothetical protein
MTTNTITTPSARTHAGRTDARTDADAGNRSQDTSLKTLLTELLEAIKRNESVLGQKRETVLGQIYIFRVEQAGAPTMDERFKACLQWMKETQITNRRVFFEQCPAAGGNANLHHRCIKALKRENLIERIGREYVFKEE